MTDVVIYQELKMKFTQIIQMVTASENKLGGIFSDLEFCFSKVYWTARLFIKAWRMLLVSMYITNPSLKQPGPTVVVVPTVQFRLYTAG